VIVPIDSEAERISLKILNALSTFENIGDLPEEAATRILLNDALRQKLSTEKDITKQIELVHEALIEDNKAAESRLQSERERSLLIQQYSKNIEAQLMERSQQVQALEAALKDQSSITAQKVDELSRVMRAKEQMSSRVRFLAESGSSLLAIAVIGYIIHWLGANRIAVVSTIGGLLVLWFIIVRFLGARRSDIKEWPLFRKFAQYTVVAVITLLFGIAGNAAWDGIKTLFTNK
jgi:hypothetical protein